MGLADRVGELRVSLDNMGDAGRWVDAIRADWDEQVIGDYQKHAEPLRKGTDSRVQAQVAGWDNSFGRFDEADAVNGDVRSAHDELHNRMVRVSQLLARLGEITTQIGASYGETELRNTATQRKVAALLDDPQFGVTR